MGIDFVAFREDGTSVFCESVNWLRNYAPNGLFYGNEHAMKDVMTPGDVYAYWKDIISYLEKLEYVAALPGETDTYNEWYDKWVSDDRKNVVEDWIYKKLQDFAGILSECAQMGLSARWSI